MKTYLTESDYVTEAEDVIKKFEQNTILSTSQIRNILSLNMDIYNDVLLITGENLPDDIIGRINYLKIRILYQCGRDKEEKVKNFVIEAKLKEILEKIVETKKIEDYFLFTRYLEALVAYKMYYYSKDKND